MKMSKLMASEAAGGVGGIESPPSEFRTYFNFLRVGNNVPPILYSILVSKS